MELSCPPRTAQNNREHMEGNKDIFSAMLKGRLTGKVTVLKIHNLSWLCAKISVPKFEVTIFTL